MNTNPSIEPKDMLLLFESLGRGLALDLQVGDVNASLVPARRLAHGQ